MTIRSRTSTQQYVQHLQVRCCHRNVRKRCKQVTLYLGKITLVYLLLSLPSNVVRLLAISGSISVDTYQSLGYQCIERLAHTAYYLQFAVNFLVYAPRLVPEYRRWRAHTRKAHRKYVEFICT